MPRDQTKSIPRPRTLLVGCRAGVRSPWASRPPRRTRRVVWVACTAAQSATAGRSRSPVQAAAAPPCGNQRCVRAPATWGDAAAASGRSCWRAPATAGPRPRRSWLRPRRRSSSGAPARAPPDPLRRRRMSPHRCVARAARPRRPQPAGPVSEQRLRVPSKRGRCRQRQVQRSSHEVQRWQAGSIRVTGGRTTHESPGVEPPGRPRAAAAVVVKRGAAAEALAAALVAAVVWALAVAAVAAGAVVASAG